MLAVWLGLELPRLLVGWEGNLREDALLTSIFAYITALVAIPAPISLLVGPGSPASVEKGAYAVATGLSVLQLAGGVRALRRFISFRRWPDDSSPS